MPGCKIEVHEECCIGCMLWWMEKWCGGGVGTRWDAWMQDRVQDRSQSSESGARWNFGQDASKGVLDGVLRSVHTLYSISSLYPWNTSTKPSLFNSLHALSSLLGWSTLELIKMNSFRLINCKGFPNNSSRRARLTN